jgi:hypothetical protein
MCKLVSLLVNGVPKSHNLHCRSKLVQLISQADMWQCLFCKIPLHIFLWYNVLLALLHGSHQEILKIKWYLRSKLEPSVSILYELATMSSNFSCNRVSPVTILIYTYTHDFIHESMSKASCPILHLQSH